MNVVIRKPGKQVGRSQGIDTPLFSVFVVSSFSFLELFKSILWTLYTTTCRHNNKKMAGIAHATLD